MSLFRKGSKAYAIFNFKCPRCCEGDHYPKPFAFDTAFTMHDKCSHCQQTYLPEPGFYYGAMFISYIMTAFFCLGFVGICILGLDMTVNQSFALLIFILTILFVYIFRLSRSIWLGVNVHYDAKYAKKE